MIGHRESKVVPRADAWIDVHWVPPDIVEAVFRGYVTARATEAAIDDVRSHRFARYFLIDATEVIGFDPDVRVPGVTLLRTLKDRKIEHTIAVAPSPGVRMIGSAVAFVAALKVEFVDTRREALARLAERRSGRL